MTVLRRVRPLRLTTVLLIDIEILLVPFGKLAKEIINPMV